MIGMQRLTRNDTFWEFFDHPRHNALRIACMHARYLRRQLRSSVCSSVRPSNS